MEFQIEYRALTGRSALKVEIGAKFRGRACGVRLGAAVKVAFASGADLSDADLRGADLRDAVLSGVVLISADLRGADLSGVVLISAVMSGAVMSGADLRGAVLSGADLRGADLRGADLRGVVLISAVMSGADLRGADLRGADLRDAVKVDRVLAIASRITGGYQFVLWRDQDGRALVTAGCRGPWPIARYREHVAAEYAGTEKAAETLCILDFFEATDRATAEVKKAAA
jgi:hypothetical protein